jgi:hypothetical protein
MYQLSRPSCWTWDLCLKNYFSFSRLSLHQFLYSSRIVANVRDVKETQQLLTDLVHCVQKHIKTKKSRKASPGRLPTELFRGNWIQPSRFPFLAHFFISFCVVCFGMSYFNVRCFHYSWSVFQMDGLYGECHLWSGSQVKILVWLLGFFIPIN